MKNRIASFTLFLAFAAVGLRAQGNHIFAQKVVEEIKAAHPEITGLEVAAIKPGKGCQTIAATEVKSATLVPPVSGCAQVAIKPGFCECWKSVKCVACAGLLAAAPVGLAPSAQA